MAHILRRLGEAALTARRVGSNGNIWLPPILSRRHAMEIRHEWLAEGKCVAPLALGTQLSCGVASALPCSAAPPQPGRRWHATQARASPTSPPRPDADKNTPFAYPPFTREWPYEHIVPGTPKNDPPYNGGRQKGHKREAERTEREARIKAAMEKMPQLIAEYRVGRAEELSVLFSGAKQQQLSDSQAGQLAVGMPWRRDQSPAARSCLAHAESARPPHEPKNQLAGLPQDPLG
jgi:hypothetical protein